MAVNLYTVLVRRDAHTITPTTVTEYEVALLQKIAGDENVTNVDGKRVDEYGIGEPVGTYGAEDEASRLNAKYGPELIAAVYGPEKSAISDKVKKATIGRSARKAPATE